MRKATVRVEEVVPAQNFELAALVNVLEHSGVLTQGDALEGIMRLKERAGKAD